MQLKHAGLIAGLLSLPALSFADVAMTPSVTLGYKNITFGAGGDSEVDVDMPTLGLGFASTFGAFTAQLNLERSLKDGDYSERTDPILAPRIVSNPEVVYEERYEGDVSRTDINLTFSYAVIDQLSVFLGYVRNTTELDNLNIRFFDEFGGELFVTNIDSLSGNIEQEDKGPVIGIRAVPFSSSFGSLSATLGYAMLDTETDVSFTVRNEDDSTTLPAPTDKVDTKGFSVGLSWVGPIPGIEKLHYVASLRLNRFTQEEEDGDINNDLTYIGGGVLYSL